jgi:hypothetical protein
MPDLISKAEFARRTNTTRQCVTNWIAAGKLTAPALVRVGRAERIDETMARAQLGARLHLDQRISRSSQSGVGADGETLEKIQRARLAQLEQLNAKAAEEAELRRGRYVLADDMRQAVGRVAGAMLAAVEGGLVEIANAVAVDTGVPPRDVVLAVRRAWRGIRGRLAGAEAEVAMSEPETIS